MIDQDVKSKMKTGQFDFITPFYNLPHNNKSLIDGIDSLLSSYDLTVKAIPFSSYTHPAQFFRQNPGKSRKIKAIKTYDGVQLFRMSHIFKNGSDLKEEEEDFFVYENPGFENVYVVLTIAPIDFFRRSILPFFESNFPHLIMTFITNKKLKKLIETFKMGNQFSDLIVTHASQRCRFNEEGKENKEFPIVSWPGMGLNKAFNWLYQNNGWFQSLKFKAMRHNSPAAEISITRQGVIRTNHLFSKVFEGFVLPICKTIHDNMVFFGNRSRRDNRNLAARPLTIDFDPDTFSDPSENIKFIQSLRRLNKASISVLHGNPYIHLSVIDYFDGSTFDLWVLNSSQLFIVPQMKGSVFSIKRLINHIFDTFAEGDIKDYRENSN